MNGQAPAGGRPANATIKPPPIASATPIRANPTRRSETACANEFHVAWSNAEKSTANTIVNVTGRLLGWHPTRTTFIFRSSAPSQSSPDVASAREAIRDDHSNIYMKINTLMEAAERGDPANVLDDLRRQVELASTALEERFIDAAKKDLGVTE